MWSADTIYYLALYKTLLVQIYLKVSPTGKEMSSVSTVSMTVGCREGQMDG